MPYIPVEPTQITIASAGAWIDIDAHDYVTVGSEITGVSLLIYAPASVNTGVRKKGCTTNFYGTYGSTLQYTQWAGVDASGIFQIYAGSKTTVVIYIVGYMTGGFVFNTTATAKNVSDALAWEDVNCTADVPDTAVGLIFYVYGSSSSVYSYGARDDGSATDVKIRLPGSRPVVAVAACTSRVAEQYAQSATYVKTYLVGYITAAAIVTWYTNKTDLSLGSTGAYADLAALPSGAIAGLIEIDTTSTTLYSNALRENGSTFDRYYDRFGGWVTVKCDANRIVEGKIENTAIDFYTVAIFGAAASGSRCNAAIGDCMVF